MNSFGVLVARGEERKEDYTFKASLGYIADSRPVWDTKQDPVSKNKLIN